MTILKEWKERAQSIKQNKQLIIFENFVLKDYIWKWRMFIFKETQSKIKRKDKLVI